jgi:AcrR family transcriptional regulator
MTTEKPDRRVQRTRQLIHQAMMALMLEKGYENITIQDILDRANIGRSTFYAHYRDKEDLLLRGIAEITYGEEVGAAVHQHIHDLEQYGVSETLFTVPMFTHVKQNLLLHEVMFSKDKENPILEKGTALLYANTKAQIERLIAEGKEPSVPISALAHFLTGGLMSLIKWWVDNDLVYSPQQMDELFQKIAMPGVREVLGK